MLLHAEQHPLYRSPWYRFLILSNIQVSILKIILLRIKSQNDYFLNNVAYMYYSIITIVNIVIIQENNKSKVY